ncbi:ParB/RepB/Spo0J family partition protein [Thiorhodovibrio frisius]|uniref:Probable chromosome-partitioning protein ParB n=1 Tax=Thiorhodovibrio frisius TaxID=631362 RepID=H8Z7L5_9GAMM|nr:ParB/RepB/Spo0J family partition protein [Thiorhodovibrio frisius]EIC19868.1 ParB-like partition protein [Thiorhodovibrio frisius]WPL20596.1 putative chromosome-partitioning protein ParB [Thiorhodovibrio frisius]
MSTKRKGLGRGLDALLGSGASSGSSESNSGAPDPAHESPTTARPDEVITELGVERIRRGRYQPRREFNPESLSELADSIAAQGVLQPIVVRSLDDGNYEIIAGERRWRATQQAGLAKIPVVVREVDEKTALAIALIENIQRDDLHPLEEASALHRLAEEFSLTHQQVAEAVGKSRTTVTNLLRLLELEPDTKSYLDQRQLEMGHARALLGLKGRNQCDAAREVVNRGLSVRETEKLVRRWQNEETDDAQKEKPQLDPNIRSLQDDLANRLGARVAIKHGGSGAGKLVIAYNNLDELDGILAHIQ